MRKINQLFKSLAAPISILLILLWNPPVLPAQQADRFAAIAPKMQAFVDQGQISGIVTLVADKDRVLHLAAVGVSNIATGRKMQTDDLFWIASMSKPITAVGIAILVDDGKLTFDDPVEKYVPEFKNITLRTARGGPATRPSRPITLRDVLTHTSGLGEMTQRTPHMSLADTAVALAKMPLRSEPGTHWSYSTAGLDLMGRVIEVASGMPFAEFMQTRIFNPLGMTQTTYWLTPEQDLRYARSYVLNPDTKKLEETSIPYMYGGAVTDHARPALGGAGLFSTAEDIARFYQMALNHGSLNGKKILKPETVAEMTRNQIGNLVARPGMPWGLGFCVITDPKRMAANDVYTPGSFGHGGAFGTSSWVDPTKGVIYIIMLQRDKMGNPDNSPMRQVFQDTAAAALNP
jgi:CubicO group peptidase (beta-lactamase class C family)